MAIDWVHKVITDQGKYKQSFPPTQQSAKSLTFVAPLLMVDLLSRFKFLFKRFHLAFQLINFGKQVIIVFEHLLIWSMHLCKCYLVEISMINRIKDNTNSSPFVMKKAKLILQCIQSLVGKHFP